MFHFLSLHDMIYRNTSEYQCEPTIEGDQSTECKLVTFVRTPIMSSYLVAFAIGIWNEEDDEDINNGATQQSVFYPKQAAFNQSRAAFALQQSINVLNEFEKPEVFGIPYNESGLTKLDSLAVSNFLGGMLQFAFIFYAVFVLRYRIYHHKHIVHYILLYTKQITKEPHSRYLAKKQSACD